MAIDLGSANGSRYYSIPDHADFSLPNGDWAWLALCNISSTSNYKYIISSGSYGGSNTFNFGSYTGGSGGFFTKVDGLTEKKWTGGEPIVGTWYWAYVTRRSNSLYIGAVPLGGSSASESTGLAISSAYNSANPINVGRRVGGGFDEYFRGQIGISSFVSGSGITSAQAIELANGASLLSMPFAGNIKFLLHGRTASATISDLISGHVATRQGSSYGTNEEDVQTPYIWAPIHVGLAASPGGGVTGTLAYTNADDTLAASGKTTVVGTLAVTNANDTVSANGTTTITGSLATTNANDTLSASGSPVVAGSLATTNADDILSASGAVGSAISGTLSVTNADDTVAASGTTTVTGVLAYTNAGDTLAASGSTTVTGTSSTTNAADTCAASGEVLAEDITGTVAYTNADDTASASGTTTIVGSAAASNSNDTLSAFGTVNDGVMVEAALVTGIATSSGIKKPGIPENAPAWLRTTLEILEGRRGNRVTIPAAANLTFSATPTQAECEALYEYTNEIRTALSSIISRFDS